MAIVAEARRRRVRNVLAAISGFGFAGAVLIHILDCLGVDRALAAQQRTIVIVTAALVFLPAAVITYMSSLDKPIRIAFTPASWGWNPRMIVAIRVAFIEYVVWLVMVIAGSISGGREGVSHYYTDAMFSSLPLTFFLVAFAAYTRDRCRIKIGERAQTTRRRG